MANNPDEAKLRDELEKSGAKRAREVDSSVPKPDFPEESVDTSSLPERVNPVDYVGAPGYNPNMQQTMLRGSDDLPRDEGLTKPNTDSPASSSAVPLEPVDDIPRGRETAPDIGKDYGNGFQDPRMGTEQATPGTDMPARDSGMSDLPPSSNLGGQNEGLGPKEGLEGNDTGLDKKDELNPDEAGSGDKDAGKKEPGTGDKTTDSDKEKGKSGESQSSDEEKKSQPENPNGNGYGALKNKDKSGGQQDGTSRARRNLEHQNQIKNDKESEKNGGKKQPAAKNAAAGKKQKPSLGSRIKNGLNKLGNRAEGNNNADSSGKGVANTVEEGMKSQIRKKVVAFFAAHPYLLLILGLFVLIIMILFVTEFDGNGTRHKGGNHCTYDLKGVTASGSVKLEGLQVELINCDGTASDYTVLETVDFEKYVLGVALAEIGPSSPDEAIKTQIIAARNFALTRNSGMCPGNQDNCFYGYNPSTGKIRMRACEADQVYWDYEKDIYRQDRGSISLYSPEITSGTLWKSALSAERIAEVQALANDVKGKVLVNSTGYVIKTPYVASTSEQFLSLANEGKTYDQILATVYEESDGFSSGDCSIYGNIDYGDYVLSSEGDQILHERLDTFLESKGTSLEEFAELISHNVQKAGYGTKAGVVAAAVTLIAELGNNYDVKVPYYWSGGHYDGVVDGPLGYWGSTECHTYANNQSYNYCGFDCSGFVPWAIKNGGFNISQMLAGDFKDLDGAKKVTLSSSHAVIEPGDLLESEGHIVLVIGIEESSGSYICAEASGNAAGVLFTRRSFGSSGYWGVNMDGYYQKHARSQ